MSFSPKIQKKPIISSRTLDFHKHQIHDSKFDHAVQKQLQEDFKVHEYLNDHPNDSHNTQKYMQLINSMLVKKNSKMKQKVLLTSHKKLCEKNRSELEGEKQAWGNTELNRDKTDVYFTEEQYLKIKQELQGTQQMIEMKTSEQLEMQKMLIKDIAQKKKSLNLLKGDMGHMIDRDQQISVLQSKVTKVCQISENQLSKITLALAKDREEVQLREKMQKKFHGKLKGVESQARKNLKAMNSSYIQTMRRRKYVHQRLTDIQKECASIEEYSDKLRQKQEKNEKSASIFMFLCNVSQAIDKSYNLCLRLQEKSITRKQHSEQLQNILFSLSNVNECYNVDNMIEDITKQNLQILTEKIIKQFRSLEQQIQYKRKEYVQEMGLISNFSLKFNKFNEERLSVNADYLLQNRNELLDEKINVDEYFKKLNALQSNFQVFYVLIDFMSKKIKKFNGIKLINQLYRNQMFYYKINSVVTNQQIEIPPKQIFNKLNSNFQLWFKDLRKIAKNSKNRRDSQQNRALRMFLMKSKSSPTGGFNFLSQSQPKQLSRTQKTDYDENINYLKTEEQSEYEGEIEVEQFSQIKCDANEMRNNGSNIEGNDEQEKAKRIQVLAQIDQNYHNMIKQTIQMEKDNTMKNYLFKQSFKRNKYSGQDEISQQKRFEATFSGFFKQDSNQSKSGTLISSSKFKCKNIDKLQKIRVPFATVHHPRSQLNIIRLSGSESFKKNVKTMQKQKKIKLSQKLKDLLSRAEA